MKKNRISVYMIALVFILVTMFIHGDTEKKSIIETITGRKPGELRVRVVKFNSKAEKMYVDKTQNRIFYFFDNEGLVQGDLINVTDKLSEQEAIVIRESQYSTNRDEYRVMNRREADNLKYIASKGDIKNRIIIDYTNYLDRIYVEFYTVANKLKKVVRNNYEEIKIEPIYVVKQENNLYLQFSNVTTARSKGSSNNNRNIANIMRLNSATEVDRIEFFTYTKNGETKTLEHSLEKDESFGSYIKIEASETDEQIYMTHFSGNGNLTSIYSIVPDTEKALARTMNLNIDLESSFHWNSPIIDITEWERKTVTRMAVANKEFYYGEETTLGTGIVVPYVDINMGKIEIPGGDIGAVGDTIEIKGENNVAMRGHVILRNSKNENLAGRLYFITSGTEVRTPVKGLNSSDIPNSTTKVKITGGGAKTAVVRLRIYDENRSNPSRFVVGETSYFKTVDSGVISNKDFIITLDGTEIYTETSLPNIEFLDTRDDLQNNLNIFKKTLDFSQEPGKTIGNDLVWQLANRFVDVKLATFNMSSFDDKLQKLKNPAIYIETDNSGVTQKIDIGGTEIVPYKYFIRVEQGSGVTEDEIKEGTFVLGHSKMSSETRDGVVSTLKGDVVLRLQREDFIEIKSNSNKKLSLKNSDGTPARMRVVLNEDYPDRDFYVTLPEFDYIIEDSDKVGSTVDLKVLLAHSEFRENTLNMVFNHKKNSTGNIEVRGEGQDINENLIEKIGYSVFDMSGTLTLQNYESTDRITIDPSKQKGLGSIRESSATFEVDGYKSIQFRGISGIEFEMKFWNGTDKAELTVNRTAYNGTSFGEIEAEIDIKSRDGVLKNRVNLVFALRDIHGSSRTNVRGSEVTFNLYIIPRPNELVYNPIYDEDVHEVTYYDSAHPVIYVAFTDTPTFTGDNQWIQPMSGVSRHGFTSSSISFKETSNPNKNGTVEGNRLLLSKERKQVPGGTAYYSGFTEIVGRVKRSDVERIWPTSSSIRDRNLEVLEFVYANGKRKIPQSLNYRWQSASHTAHLENESYHTTVNQIITLGNYYGTMRENGYVVTNSKGELLASRKYGPPTTDANADRREERLDTNDARIDVPVLFKGKETYPLLHLNVADTSSSREVWFKMPDVFLSKEEHELDTFKFDRYLPNGNPDGSDQARRIHRVIVPKYAPISEAYSPSASFQTNSNGSPREVGQPINIDRVDLGNPSSALAITMELGTVGILGRDSARETIVKRNSKTLNILRLADIMRLKEERTGKIIEAEVSFSPTALVRDVEQVRGVDKLEKLYLQISKTEAEKMEPGEQYILETEFEAGRIDENRIEGRNLVYIGLKTDNTADLGLDEYIYDPIFSMKFHTTMRQNNTLRLEYMEGKPLIRSDGNSNLTRIYLSEATYSTDTANPDRYSKSQLSGLVTPYEYDNPEYAGGHRIRVSDGVRQLDIDMNASGGTGKLETAIGTLIIGYRNNPALISGLSARNPLEILTLGFDTYNFRAGNVTLKIEEFKKGSTTEVLATTEILLLTPTLDMRDYLDTSLPSLMKEKPQGIPIKVAGNKVIYRLGDVGIQPELDTEITKRVDDSVGVRIEYDENITLTAKNGNGAPIQGRIVVIDGNGNELPGGVIGKISKTLAIEIDMLQQNYDANLEYIYLNGDTEEQNSSIERKPIRIGREQYWKSLVSEIEIQKITDTNWSSPAVDLTDWDRKAVTRTRAITANRDVIFGEEIVGGVGTIPYVEIKMGEIKMNNLDVADTLRIRADKNIASERGKVILHNSKGETLNGRVFMRSSSGTSLPVKGMNNNNIVVSGKTDGQLQVFFGSDSQVAEVYLRIYDEKKESPSRFLAGRTSYLESTYNLIFSSKDIEVMKGTTTLYAEDSIPNVEFIDIRDNLQENLTIMRKPLDFSQRAGVNHGDDIVWQLANRFVDVKLATFNLSAFDDQLQKLKNPYIIIDTDNNGITQYMDIGTERVVPHKYFITTEQGSGIKDDEITEGTFVLGHSKISSETLEGTVLSLKGNLVIRLQREDFLEIGLNPAKKLDFRNADGTPTKMRVVMNADHPGKYFDVELPVFDYISDETDKTGNTVTLGVLLAREEYRENNLNLVFNHRKNSSGNIETRGEGQDINENLNEKVGYSVFDMSGALAVQNYAEDDVVTVLNHTGIDAGDISFPATTFSVHGYKGVRFKGIKTGDDKSDKEGLENLEFELRFWKGTDKLELNLTKGSYSGLADGAITISAEIRAKDGVLKNRVNLSFASRGMDIKTRTWIRRPDLQGNILPIFNSFTENSTYNEKMQTLTSVGTNDMSLYVEDALTFPGDKRWVQPLSGVSRHGFTSRAAELSEARGVTVTYGRIEGVGAAARLVLDEEGRASAVSTSPRINYGAAGLLLRMSETESNRIWPTATSERNRYLETVEFVYGNGKRRIPQTLWYTGFQGGTVTRNTHESIVINKEDFFEMGLHSPNPNGGTNKIVIETPEGYELINVIGDLVGANNVQYPTITVPATNKFNFRGKEIGTRYSGTSPLGGGRFMYVSVDDIVLVSEEQELVTLQMTKTGTGIGSGVSGIHKIILPKYDPKEEAYSPSSSLTYNGDGTARNFIQSIEIVRLELEDAATTYAIQKELGVVGVLGRDEKREKIMRDNSLTLNTLKVADKVVLKNESRGQVIQATISLDENIVVKELTQTPGKDTLRKLYLNISKSEAEKLVPGIEYVIESEFNAGRIADSLVKTNNLVYIGLKTDNVAKLGLDEWHYDPIFSVKLNTTIKQDTAVRVTHQDGKALIKSSGASNLTRIYLSEAKYSTDILNPDRYSNLTMRGLLTPFEYDHEDLGGSHTLVATDLASGRNVEILMNSSAGQGELETAIGKLYIGYLNDSSLTGGLTARNPLEVLAVGVKEYNFTEGEVELSLLHRASGGAQVIREGLKINFPKFEPREWYYNEDDPNKLKADAVAFASAAANNRVIMGLGNVSIYPDIDTELSKDGTDPMGVRIEYDDFITFVDKMNPSLTIQGGIVALDASGNKLPKESIGKVPTTIGIEIDTTQENYRITSDYRYEGGDIETQSSSTTNMPVRIGRAGHWKGLLRSVEVQRLLEVDWNTPIIDITNWDREKAVKLRTITANKEWTEGRETVISVGEVPYIEIKMGEISMPNISLADTLRIKADKNTASERGKVTIQNSNGQVINGRVFMRSASGTSLPAIGMDNQNITESGKTSANMQVFFGSSSQVAEIYLRIYDIELGKPSRFIEGGTKYYTSGNALIFSSKDIEVLKSDILIYSEDSIPNVEFINTKESLSKNLDIMKKTLDFSKSAGTSIGEDMKWQLANRFLDVRLARFNLSTFDDKLQKIKNPAIYIDTDNTGVTQHLQIGTERLTPYKYFLRVEQGNEKIDSDITEGSFILGHNAIYSDTKEGTVDPLIGDIVIRIQREDFLEIQQNPSKKLSLRDASGALTRLRVVMNEDYPNQDFYVDIPEFDYVGDEAGKGGNTVTLGAFLERGEFIENTLNMVFNHKKNGTGNIEVRGEGQDINDNLAEKTGKSVFDMSGALAVQNYIDTDVITITNPIGITNQRPGGTVKDNGYRGAKFTGIAGIEFEIRFWNGTDKLEIALDKSATYNATIQGETRAEIEIRSQEGILKNRVNLNFSLRPIGNEKKIWYRNGDAVRYLNVGTPTYNATYGEKMWAHNTNAIESPYLLVQNIRTYHGDKIFVQPQSGTSSQGFTSRTIEFVNFGAGSTAGVKKGIVEDGKLILDSTGTSVVGNQVYATSNINFRISENEINRVWPLTDPKPVREVDLEILEIVYGNGKRTLQETFRVENRDRGTNTVHTDYEITLTDTEEFFEMGRHGEDLENTKQTVSTSKEQIYFQTTHLVTGANQQNINMSLLKEADKTFDFRGKPIMTRYGGTSRLGRNREFHFQVRDIPIVSEETYFETIRVDNATTLTKGRFKINLPAYDPIGEAYSLNSSIQPTAEKQSRKINRTLEIIRDDINDSETTARIEIELGRVGLLGRDSFKRDMIRKSSSTLNMLKIADRVVLRNENGEQEDIPAEISLSRESVIKEMEQETGVDKLTNLYLTISASEAKKLRQNAQYRVVGEFNSKRIEDNLKVGENLMYVGLKTDNEAELGFNEYIYKPIFSLAFQTVIRQDTSVRLAYQDGKPLIKSNGTNNFARVYLAEGRYSIDLGNSREYSDLDMRGLHTPYEYDAPEYGSSHTMVIRDKISGNSTPVTMSSVGGQGVLTTGVGDIYVGYLNNSSLTSGLSARNPLEVLTIGLKSYNFEAGAIDLEIEHRDPVIDSMVLLSENLAINIPTFRPRNWYYNENDSNKLESNIVRDMEHTIDSRYIYPLGDVSLYSNIDREITKGTDDPIGVRVDYDENIELVNKNNSTNRIEGRIIQIDSRGREIPKSIIGTVPSTLAIEVDVLQSEYLGGVNYIYTDGEMSNIGSSVVNKPIRIGRNNHWQGLLETIDLNPVALGNLIDFNWDTGMVDITTWERKDSPTTRGFEMSEVVYGVERHGAQETPYIDVKMGNMEIFRAESANIIAIDHLDKATNRGVILLETPDGREVAGRIYLKPRVTRDMIPVKDIYNNDIPGSTLKIRFEEGEHKESDVRIRIYDNIATQPTKIVEGIYKYKDTNYSNNRTINISYDNGDSEVLVRKDTTIPSIEVVDLRDKLRDNVHMKKKILNFTTPLGDNIGTDTMWVFGDRYVDIKLAEFSIGNFLDQTSKIQNPYLEISRLAPDVETGDFKENSYKYFMKIRNGVTDESNQVRDEETNQTIGYTKVTAEIKNNQVGNMEGDIYVRLTSSQYLAIQNDPSKIVEILKSNGASEDITVIFNSDDVDNPKNLPLRVPFGEFTALKAEEDKRDNNVSLRGMIYVPEIRENIINMVFDPKKNSTGNIGIRSNFSGISENHQELTGYTVFDMPKGILQNQYRDTDIIEVAGGITNATVVGMTGSTFNRDGFKSLRFNGNNGIQYELKFWNNTDKVEITMDKTNFNGNSARIYGVVNLKDSLGNLLNSINMGLYINNLNLTHAIRAQTEHLKLQGSYTVNPDWNKRVELARFVQSDSTLYRIHASPGNEFHSYDGDRVFIEPIRGVGPEGLEGRGVSLVPFSGNQGTVSGNRIEFTRTTPGLSTNGLGSAQMSLIVPEDWVNNHWGINNSNNKAQNAEMTVLELVYGNGKRRVPQFERTYLWNQNAPTAGIAEYKFVYSKPEDQIRIGRFMRHVNNDLAIYETLPDSTKKELLVRFTGTDNATEYHKDLPNLKFKGKELKRRIWVWGASTSNWRGVEKNLLDIPLIAEEASIGFTESHLYGGSATGLDRVLGYIKAYNPIVEAYSLTSSIKANFDGTPRMNNINFNFNRESIENRDTTLEVNAVLGTASVLGKTNQRNNEILRSSTTLNILKLPNRATLRRMIGSDIVEEIPITLSFDSGREVLDFNQVSTVDREALIYMNISENNAKKLDDGINYVIHAEYDAGRVAKNGLSTDNLLYFGLKTDNESDLGFDEYIYAPVAKMELQSNLEKDSVVSISMNRDGLNKPIPKADGINGLVRIYGREIKYSPEITKPEEYTALTMVGSMKPYPYERENLNVRHYLELIDGYTGQLTRSFINSSGGYGDIRTPLGVFTVGYSANGNMNSGFTATNSMNVTTFGIKEYNFVAGERRIHVNHLDPLNTNEVTFSETLLIRVPEFKPRAWYYDETNSNKLETTGIKYLEHYTKDHFIYNLGDVGMLPNRDRSITIKGDDLVGARIEYTKNIQLEQLENSANKISAEMVRLDSNGNILSDMDIISGSETLGIKIDRGQPGYDSSKTYILKGDTTLGNDSTNRDIRIGRNGYWESLVSSIHLSPVNVGDIRVDLDKRYLRNSVLSYNSNGDILSGAGGVLNIEGEFLTKLPNSGVIEIYKWNDGTVPYGEKLAETTVSGGAMVGKLNIKNETSMKTNYTMNIEEWTGDKFNISFEYFGEDIFNERIHIRVTSSEGIVSLHRLNLNVLDTRSMILIDYVSNFAPDHLPEIAQSSLYMGNVLNPNSFPYPYDGMRFQMDSLNSLRILYQGDDIGLENSIRNVKLVDRNIILREDGGGVLELEDISLLKIAKRYQGDSPSTAYFEELYQMKAYFNPKKHMSIPNGTYKTTIRVEIELD